MLSQLAADGQSRIVGWNLASGSGEREVVAVQEEDMSTDGTLVLSSSIGSAQRIVLQLVKLPLVDKIPPYTTWIFLDKYSVATLFDQFDNLIRTIRLLFSSSLAILS